MKKLEQLISPNNLVGLFDNIHAMIALVQSDGVLISWNHAFEEIKNSSVSINKLENIFSEKDRPIAISKLAFASHDNWIAEVVLNEASLVVCDSHGEWQFTLYCRNSRFRPRGSTDDREIEQTGKDVQS